jgi:hypothetical protein
MSNPDDIAALKQEIAVLRAELAELREITRVEGIDLLNRVGALYDLLKDDSTNTTAHIREIYTVLWPVVYRVFPNYAAGLKEIDACLARFDGEKRTSG